MSNKGFVVYGDCIEATPVELPTPNSNSKPEVKESPKKEENSDDPCSQYCSNCNNFCGTRLGTIQLSEQDILLN